MMRELRKDLRDGLSGALTRGNRGEFDVRMMEEQPHQFLPGVTGGADDGDFFFHVGCPRSVVRGPWSVVRGPLLVVGGSSIVLAETPASRNRQLTTDQTKKPRRRLPTGLAWFQIQFSVCYIGIVCGRPAGRISCARACADRA